MEFVKCENITQCSQTLPQLKLHRVALEIMNPAPSSSSSSKRTLWIVSQLTQDHERRSQALIGLGHNVVFATTLDQTVMEAEQTRPSTIIFDSLDDFDAFEKWLKTIIERRSLAATRLILNITRLDTEVSQAAWIAGFRDLISNDLPDKVWLSRVQFSSSSKALQVGDVDGSISLTSPATVTVPGRIVWINESHVRLEFKGQQALGSTMVLRGPLTKSLGTDHLSLTVDTHDRKHLLYRYSHAFECRWSVPDKDYNRVTEQIRLMRVGNKGPRRRAFIAGQDPLLRKSLTDLLSNEEFEVNVALQRSQINSELKFFSPDVFVIDDTLARSFDDDQIKDMMEALPNHAIAIVINSAESKKPFSKWLLQRAAAPILSYGRSLTEVLSEIKQKIDSYVIDHTPGTTDPVYLPLNHPLSAAELDLDAKLKLISPRYGALALSSPMSNFALAKLDAPIIQKSIGREIYIKIIHSYESRHLTHRADFSYICDFMLNDLSQHESTKLSQQIIQFIAYYYQEFNTRIGLFNGPQKRFQSIQDPSGTLAHEAENKPNNGTLTDAADTIDQGQTQEELQNLTDKAPNENVSQKQGIVDEEPNNQATTSTGNKSIPSLTFEWHAYVDPVIAKALGLFLVAAAIMGFILYTASNVEKPASEELGKVYSDFFIRMRDAEPIHRQVKPEEK